MSLAVVNLGGTNAANVATGYLADLNLSSTQSAQIEQILAELASGVISPVEARAQMAAVVSHAQQSSAQGQTQTRISGSQSSEPITQYYELPLPQESLKGAIPSYNAHGAATQAVFSAPKTVNASA